MGKFLTISLRTVSFFASLVFFFYLALPTPSFPIQLPDSVQSLEEADVESPLRRAYFTNFNREQVLDFYQKQMEKPILMGIPLPTYRLNHPPEEAYTLVRDQTRSTFLEEIVHPFRESLFVNGFKPKVAKDEIHYKGVRYEQKITVRYIPSSAPVRMAIGFFAVVALIFSTREFLRTAGNVTKEWIFKE